jgi:hypothetical protein
LTPRRSARAESWIAGHGCDHPIGTLTIHPQATGENVTIRKADDSKERSPHDGTTVANGWHRPP